MPAPELEPKTVTLLVSAHGPFPAAIAATCYRLSSAQHFTPAHRLSFKLPFVFALICINVALGDFVAVAKPEFQMSSALSVGLITTITVSVIATFTVMLNAAQPHALPHAPTPTPTPE